MVYQVPGDMVVRRVYGDFSEIIEQSGILHYDGDEAIPEVVHRENGLRAELRALVLRGHEVAAELDGIRQVLIYELLREAELVGACEHRLSLAVQHGVGAEEEAVAADDGLVVRVPDDQLLVGLFHLVVLVEVDFVARGAAGLAEGDFTKAADFGDDVGGVVPGNDVKLVMPLVGVFQLLGFGKLCLEQFDWYWIYYLFHRVEGFNRYLQARGWRLFRPYRALSCGRGSASWRSLPFWGLQCLGRSGRRRGW